MEYMEYMEYDVFISNNHKDYAAKVLNALRDYEAENGNGIKMQPHLKPEEMDCFGCYAETGNTLLGGLLFSIQNEWIFLSSGFVWPNYRGMGIYSSIIKNIEEKARANKCNGIFVSTYDFECPHIYEHFGFKKGSVLPDMPKGNTNIDYFKPLNYEV